MKKSIITIGGTLGSGKSSTGDTLAQILGYSRYSMGNLQRKYAESLGMDLTAYSEMQKKDHTIDKKVDEYQTELGRVEDNFILDSRLGWYFIPESFKVFLKLPTEIAADRIVKDSEKNETRRVESFESKEDLIGKIEHRVESERKRYKDLYNIDNHFDESHYNIVIDTSKHTLPEVVAIIQKAYEKWKEE